MAARPVEHFGGRVFERISSADDERRVASVYSRLQASMRQSTDEIAFLKGAGLLTPRLAEADLGLGGSYAYTLWWYVSNGAPGIACRTLVLGRGQGPFSIASTYDEDSFEDSFLAARQNSLGRVQEAAALELPRLTVLASGLDIVAMRYRDNLLRIAFTSRSGQQVSLLIAETTPELDIAWFPVSRLTSLGLTEGPAPT